MGYKPITEEYLFNKGFKKITDNLYETIDKETGMTVEFEFNPNSTIEETEKIIREVIQILIRRD